MAVEIVELKVSEEVSATTDVADTYTPANGATVDVFLFVGCAAHDPNSACCIYWDWGGAGETLLWSTKGTQDTMNPGILIDDCDGVKKLAIVCKNGTAGSLILTAKLCAKVYT